MLNFFYELTQVVRQMFFMLGYFGNLNSFPKALTKKEEDELLIRLKAGDKSARDELIEKNLRLVAYVTKKYLKDNKNSDDLISIGTIGLIKAVDSFDTDKKIRFATYAVRCIENEVLMVLRSEKKLVNEVSLEEPIGKDAEGNAILLIDILYNDEENVFNDAMDRINGKKLRQAMEECLTEREREIIILRYGLSDGNCVPQREIAKKMGISRSYVSRIEKKALDKLYFFMQ